MSSSTSILSPEHHLQFVRQLYLDASLIEQTIQHHVEANKVGYRSTDSPRSSSASSDRRLNLSDTSSLASQNHRRQAQASPQNQRRSGRQQSNQRAQADEQGFQIPPSSHFRSSHEELGFLRDSLKDVYEAVLLEDLIAAVEKSVDERLWRHVFYTPIEELRAELRKLDKNSSRRQEVMDELSKLLDKGTGFYHEMITALRCEHEIDLTTVAIEVLQAESGTGKGKPVSTLDNGKGSQGRSRNGRSRQQPRSKEDATSGPVYSTESLANCIQKCFIYLGDLARYRTNIRLETQAMLASAQPAGKDAKTPQVKPSASDWQAAHRFYTRAIQTFPDSGKPYGQLAILASYANDDLDALYWYTLSLGAKCPSIVVRDNLKVFFSRYQNRFKDLLSAICPPVENSSDAMSTDDETDIPRKAKSAPVQQLALTRCDIDVLFIKIEMDLFAPHLESATFRDSNLLNAFCHKLNSELTKTEGFDGTVRKMVVSMVLVVYDLHARTSLSSFTTESTTKEGAFGLKQAQRAGLVYLFGMITVVLERQLSLLNEKDQPQYHGLNQELLLPTQLLIEFWISHWDQVWGMIRLEEKWAGMSSGADLSLRRATVAFFRSLVNLINVVQSHDLERPSQDDIPQKALYLLQDDRRHYFGLLPFRRFHTQLTVCFDVVEDPEKTRFYRLLLFVDKVIQATEGIRGTVVELSIEPLSEEDEAGGTHYRMLDADDKRLLRERGSKMLASHWLQDQVSSLQKGLENTERRGAHAHGQDGPQNRRENTRARPLVPISTLPGTVRLPLSGQTRLTDHYQRGAPKFAVPNAPHRGRPAGERSNASSTQQQQQSRSRPEKHAPPHWTCVVDVSVLVWNLSEIKTLLDHRRCLIIVPLDVIDRLDQAKKGQDKENQKAREAIRFLDERLNIVRWGMSQPLLVGQNVRDSLGRWSEAVPYMVEEEEEEQEEQEQEKTEAIIANGGDLSNGDHVMSIAPEVEQDGDVVMGETPSITDPESATSDLLKSETGMQGVTAEDAAAAAAESREDEEEVEIRNVMNVPRVWRPILGACLFMLRKREEAHRIPEDRFVLLTEDPGLAYYANWFDIPTSTVHAWKHNGL